MSEKAPREFKTDEMSISAPSHLPKTRNVSKFHFGEKVKSLKGKIKAKSQKCKLCVAWNQNEFPLQDCYLWSVFSTALSHGIKCWKILKSQMWEILKKQSCRNFCQFLVNFWIDIFCLYSQPRDQMLEKMKTALLCSRNFCVKHCKCNRISYVNFRIGVFGL